MFETLPERANSDDHILRLGRNCTTEFVLAVDETPYHVRIDRGRVAEVLKGPFKMRGTSFSIAASSGAWSEFMTAAPKPGFHDIFAMSATGNARIEGDMTVLLGHLLYFKTLLASMREG